MNKYLEAIEFGFSPIPLRGKIPINKDWINKDKSWFYSTLENHTGNIGIRTGKLSGIIVLDCDKPRANNPTATDGNKDMADIIFKETGELDPTELPTTIDKSGSNSLRFYFRYNPNLQYLSKISGMNIDILSDKKQCCYIGSTYEGCCIAGENKHKCGTTDLNHCLYAGNKYEWVNSPSDHFPMDIPEWLLKYITKPEKPKRIIPDICLTEKLENNKVKEIFDNLSTSRWEDFESWRTLVWLALKLNLSSDDIQNYSCLACNYNFEATEKLINDYSDDKCSYTLGTLFHYLKQDVDNITYTKIIDQHIQKYITKCCINELFHTEGFTEMPDKYVNEAILNNDKCIVIKAGLGRGKSTASVKHINSNNYERIIVLTPRRTYAKSIKNRLNSETKHNFCLYSDMTGKRFILNDAYIVVQVESLNRIKLDKRKTLLICDEVESLLFQMTISETHKQKHMENLDMFQELFQRADKIICMDAFISNRTINTLNHMKIPFKYYNYSTPLENRTCVSVSEKKVFLKKLLSDLAQGKKIFLFSSSNKQLTDYLLPRIKKYFPLKNIIEYHSKMISINLTTINDNWKNADIIACTSTITVGCNFDTPNIFDKIYVYANASSKNLVRDIFQSTYRIRHFKDKEMVYCLDPRHFGLNKPTNKHEIKYDLKTSRNNIIIQYETQRKMVYQNKDTPKWINELVLFNTQEQNISIMNLEPLFDRYLEECNYDNEELDEEDIESEYDFGEDEIPIENIDYEDIEEITFSQVKELRNKKMSDSLSKYEEAQLEKYYFQFMLVDNRIWENELQLWDIYKDFGKNKFRNISFEKGLNEETLRLTDIVSTIYPEICSKFALRVEIIQEITTTLGIQNSQDFTIVERDKIDNTIDYFKNNSNRINDAFELRNRKTTNTFNLRNTTDLINKVFAKWGYSSLKKGKKVLKGTKGKQVDITPFNLENDNDNINVYKHIRGRKSKKTMYKVGKTDKINPML